MEGKKNTDVNTCLMPKIYSTCGIFSRCWAVLDIVPQTVEMACAQEVSKLMEGHSELRAIYSTSSSPALEEASVCLGELSLER